MYSELTDDLGITPPLTKIIADIGINHNGDVRIAKQLATEAKRAGATYVKLQKRHIESCYSTEELAAACESPWGQTVEDKVRGRELTWDQIADFDAHCRKIGIEWSASCFDLVSLAELDERYPDRPWNKVPSCMAMSFEFLVAVARQKKLAIVSTGLLKASQISSLPELFFSLECPYVVLHCCSKYPSDEGDLNLLFLHRLASYPTQRFCEGYGYSGHEVGILPSIIAVVLGAEWIERHITLDKAMYGADQHASLEPWSLRRLVDGIAEAETALGVPEKILTGVEKIPVRLPAGSASAEIILERLRKETADAR